MGGANIGITAVGRTEEKRLLPLVVVGGAVSQLAPAVGAVEQPGEHTHNACPCGPAAVLAEGLDKGKGFPINDGGVGVRKYFPILLRPVQLLFLLERLAAGTEIDSIAYILLPVQNARHCAGTPVTGVCRRFGRTIDTHALKILAGSHHALRA